MPGRTGAPRGHFQAGGAASDLPGRPQTVVWARVANLGRLQGRGLFVRPGCCASIFWRSLGLHVPVGGSGRAGLPRRFRSPGEPGLRCAGSLLLCSDTGRGHRFSCLVSLLPRERWHVLLTAAHWFTLTLSRFGFSFEMLFSSHVLGETFGLTVITEQGTDVMPLPLNWMDSSSAC